MSVVGPRRTEYITGVTKWPYAIGWCWWCSYGRMVLAIFS